MATPGAFVPAPADDPSYRDEAVAGLLQGYAWQLADTHLLTYSLHSDTTLASWSAARTNAVDQAFAAWAAVADIRFQRIAGPIDYELTAADLAITISEDLEYVFPGATAVGVFPDPAYANTLLTSLGLSRSDYPRPEGDVFLNAFSYELNYSSPGGAGFAVGLHEIGHALGLKHPHDDGGNARPTYAGLGIAELDNGLDTIMSYVDAFPLSPWYDRGYQVTPMVLDILAMQHIYGANMSYRTGNDTYRLLDDNKVRAIWDAGGIDTFDASSLAAPVTIALSEGAMIEHGPYSRTAIAYHVTIENAIGGAHNDTLTGNDADNRLDGRGGADLLAGGLGNDTYVVDRAGDVIVELPGEGTDTVQSSVSYTLGANVENLVLTGAGAINGTGNGLANQITGNAAANLLDGGGGADTLVGGAGADTYVVDDAGDVVSETSTLAGEIDTVISTVSFVLGANLENLTLTGGGAIDGTGNALANRIVGNVGDNILAGGAGNDTYVVQNSTDSVVEVLNGGADVVESSASFILGDHIETLVLTGMGNLDGTGNGLKNVLTGNAGNNRLDGGGGADTLTGGLGDDTYVVDNAGDTVTEAVAAGGGTDTVEAGVSWVLGANLENLVLTGAGNVNGTGNALNNVLTGNAGANVLDGGAGVDVFAGGLGNDTYVLDAEAELGNVTEAAAEGTDTLKLTYANAALVAKAVDLTAAGLLNVENVQVTGTGLFNLTGNDLDNALTGNASANVLTGGLGNDVLNGGAGADTLAGGAGDDTYVVDAAGDIVTEQDGEGTDTVQSSVSYTLGANVENLVLTGAGAINGTGNGLANQITGNAAANLLDGGAGADTLAGGLGADTYVVDDAGDIVTETSSLATEIDTVRASVSHTLTANVENLVLTGMGNLDGTGNGLKNVLTGNAGNNRLDGGGGADTLTGGLGDDTYVVDNAGDTVTEAVAAGGGTDTVEAGVSWVLGANLENLVLTGAGNVNGTGNALNNVLTGNAGANVLDGGAGVDVFAGGLGNDTYVLDAEAELGNVTEAAAEGTDTLKLTYANAALVAKAVDLTAAGLLNVENVQVTGTGLFNLTGNDLDNALTGNASANVLTGGLGNDVLNGGAGADTLAGGAGDDTYVVDAAGDIVTEQDGEGTDTVQSSVSYTLGANVENLVLTGAGAINGTGNGLANQITGNAAANLLDGGAGADTLAGGLGADTYVVDDAGDIVTETSSLATEIDTVRASVSHTLTANVENLVLTGMGNLDGTGNGLKNVLTGNAGNNRLDGGGGADTLTGGLGDDTYVVDNAGDTVTEAVAAGGGTDTVEAGVSWVLGANLENLVLTGAGNVNGTGNALNNVLTGNAGANVLDGGAGVDVFAGGLGNDTYVLDAEAELGNVTEAAAEGTDTLKLTYANAALVAKAVDLTAAGLLNVENVQVTGTGLFNLTGNDLDNALTGNASANVLTGGLGNDVLNGGAGADTLAGGAGDDTYVVDAAGDIVTEQDGEGTDTVQSSVSYTLGANVENLVLTGAGAINGTGNGLANQITGNAAANLLDGGAGADTLAGGLGADTYVVDDAGDIVTETSSLATEIDTVRASVSHTLTANVENLVLTGMGNLDGTGNGLKNVLTGNAGNNRLDGGGGADTLTGGLGDDTYVVDNAGDTVTEAVAAGGGTDTVEAGVSWVLGANLENLVLTGAGNVNGTGNALNNVLTGNAGANVLDGGAGVDVFAGGLGNDTYVLDAEAELGNVTEAAAEGTDTLKLTYANAALVAKAVDLTAAGLLNVENVQVTGTGLFNLTGNDLDNALTGNASANVLTGGLGNDVLNGGAGADTLAGGAGDDTYVVDAAGDIVTEQDGEGTDTVQSSVSYTLGANVENLVLTGAGAINGTGNGLANQITGNAAANLLDGGAGADTLAGGLGADTYVVDDAGDIVTETSSLATEIDTVRASVSHTLTANVENLVLTGMGNLDGTGNGLKNVLTGNAGNNRLDGGGGADTLTGGLGDDTYVVDNAGDTVTEAVAAGGGTDTVEAGVSWVLGANLENLVLTGAGNVNGTGNALNNVLTGNAGANVLDGGAGVDVFAGGLGNDTYVLDAEAELGNVTEAAAEGTDTLKLTYANAALVAKAVDLTAAGLLNVENVQVTGTGLFNLTGNDLDNALTGNASANVLTGGLGNDVLNGGAGADTLAGGAGDDTYVVDAAGDIVTEQDGEGTDTVQSSVSYTLGANVENLVLTGAGAINGTGNGLANQITGNAAANLLDGGAGADSLYGGFGNDVLTGGAGADCFCFNTALNAAYNLDRIGDFVAAIDQFMLDGAVFSGLAPGALAPDAFASGAGMTAAATTSQRIIYNLTTGMLYWDADGKPASGTNRAPVAFAQLTSAVKPALSAADFQIFSA